MRIAGQANLTECERALSALANSTGKEPLQLPTHIRYVAGGAEAALTQAIITWAQRTTCPTLKMFISSSIDDQIDDFIRRLPGLSAALSAQKILADGGKVDITAEVKASALKRLELLQSKRPKAAYRGSSVEIICADHLGRGAPYLLYRQSQTGGTQLRPRENFRSLAAWLLRATVPRRYHGIVDQSAPEALGGLLYEIFRNTEDHALVNESRDILDVSIRGVKTNYVLASKADLTNMAREYEPLETYYRALEPRSGAVQNHLFELSVFDSGPGFAPSWTGRALQDLSDAEEERAVRACFERGSAKGQGRFGEGLPHVIRILRRHKGFLRLRTGRMSFFAKFSDRVEEKPEWLCRHVATGKLAPAAGSLITIILPIGSN